jgi:WD40 repeat protein
VKDSDRFVIRFFEAIEASAHHVYHSALFLSPLSSLVRALYREQIPAEPKLLNPIDDSWEAYTIVIPTPIISTIAYSHNDNLIGLSGEYFFEIFDSVTGQLRLGPVLTDNSGHLRLAFSPDDILLVTGCKGGVVSIWDLQSGGLVNSLKGHTGRVLSVAFSPCGTMIASGSEGNTIRIWDASSCDCRCIPECHTKGVRQVCWSGTGREVISGSDDGKIKVWEIKVRDISRERCVKTFIGICPIASLENSSLCAFSSWDRNKEEGRVQVFDVQSGEIIQTISTESWIYASCTRELDCL